MGAVVVARARSVSARTFLRIALASCIALFVVITSGAFVRLTGSGLGCENWPSCGDKPYPEQGFHAFVEFGNRMVALVGIVLTLAAWLASRWTTGLSRWGRWAALGAFLVAIAQIPMGGMTIALDLHPLAVMTHFLLGLAAFGLALIAVLEAWSLRDGLAPPAGPRWLRQLVTWVGLPVCMTLVVTGAVVTASGPHPGSSEDVKRLGVGIVDTMYVHVRAAAVFGIGVLVARLAALPAAVVVPRAVPHLDRTTRRTRRAGDPRRGAVPQRLALGPRARARRSSRPRSGPSASRSRSLSGARPSR